MFCSFVVWWLHIWGHSSWWIDPYNRHVTSLSALVIFCSLKWALSDTNTPTIQRNLSAFPIPPRPLGHSLQTGGVCLCDVSHSKQSPPQFPSGRRVSRATALLPLKGQ